MNTRNFDQVLGAVTPRHTGLGKDTCFIGVGVGSPFIYSRNDWLAIQVKYMVHRVSGVGHARRPVPVVRGNMRSARTCACRALNEMTQGAVTVRAA